MLLYKQFINEASVTYRLQNMHAYAIQCGYAYASSETADVKQSASLVSHPEHALLAFVQSKSQRLGVQVISTALGYVLPNLISRQATQHAATALYTFFGLRLLWIAWRSKPQGSNQVSRLNSCTVPPHDSFASHRVVVS